MRIAQFGELDVCLTGGAGGDAGGSGPLVVLLHGYGAPGDDLVALAGVYREFPDVRFAFPAAPLSLSGMGYGDARAWWHIDAAALERAVATGVPRDQASSVPDGMPEARAKVLATLEALEAELGADPAQTLLGGFSQGAMLSCDVALHSDRPLRALALMSGTLVSRDEWQPRMQARAGLAIMQSHGRQDPLLAFDQAEILRDLWREAGASVDWVEFSGGHEIPPPVLQGLGGLIVGQSAS